MADSVITLMSPSSCRSVGCRAAVERDAAPSALPRRLCAFKPEPTCACRRQSARCSLSTSCAIVKVRSFPRPARICPKMRSSHASP
eukprot:179171-Prymnesium_polylepis.1